MIVFFFQAEDGIRDVAVTGVQTCALPISSRAAWRAVPRLYAIRLQSRCLPQDRKQRTARQAARDGLEARSQGSRGGRMDHPPRRRGPDGAELQAGNRAPLRLLGGKKTQNGGGPGAPPPANGKRRT